MSKPQPAPPSQSLEPRRIPGGRRARETVERILASTAALLDEIGFDALTTNGIAARAGVNVASLYKYFPNKYAVLVALADRMRDEQIELLSRPIVQDPAAAIDWRDELQRILDAYLDLFLHRTGFATLAAVLTSSAPLREIDEASLTAEARVIAERLSDYGVPGRRAEREAIGRVVLEAARGVLPLARAAAPAARRRLMRELQRMIEAYLASYLDDARDDA